MSNLSVIVKECLLLYIDSMPLPAPQKMYTHLTAGSSMDVSFFSDLTHWNQIIIQSVYPVLGTHCILHITET